MCLHRNYSGIDDDYDDDDDDDGDDDGDDDDYHHHDDVDDADEAAWAGLAQWFADAQVRAVTDGVSLVLSRAHLAAEAPFVVAGVGVEVLREAARRLGRDVVDFDSLVDTAPAARAAVSQGAPAVAVAVLASMMHGHEQQAGSRRTAGVSA